MQLPFQDLSEEDEMGHRIFLINALIDLGRVKKVPSERIIPETNTKCAANNNRNSTHDKPSPSPEPRDRPISLTNQHCLFCVFQPHYQCYFASTRKAREHFEKHLRDLKRDEPMPCPDKFCRLVIHGHEALKSHAERVHSVCYFTEAQRIQAGF